MKALPVLAWSLGAVVFAGLAIAGGVGAARLGVDYPRDVRVFMKDDIGPSEQSRIGALITGLEPVQGVFYVSKKDAFREYKALFHDSPQLFENLEAKAFPNGVEEISPSIAHVRSTLDMRARARSWSFALGILAIASIGIAVYRGRRINNS